MANLLEDIQCASSDTRPPMLDKADFASWQQRIRLYCRGKENGVNILKSIDEGPFQMGTTRDEKDRYNADIRATNIILQGLPKDIYSLINHYTDAKDIWDNVKMLLEGSELTKEDRESQLYDDFEHFRQNKGETIHDYYVRFAKLINDMRNIKMTMSKIQLNSKQHEAHANENKMMLERLTQQTVDPLALMSNVSPQHYHSQSSTNPPTTYHQPHSADTSQSDLGLSPTDNLIENLTNTLALLTQSYKTFLPQTNNQLRTSSNPRNQATVQDGRVVVQNVQGRQNRGQGNNAWGAGAVGYGRAQNRVGNANLGQARQLLLMQAKKMGCLFGRELLLVLAGGQDNAIDEDVDEQPVQDLALNVDNVFQADDCDASVCDEAGPFLMIWRLIEYVKDNAVSVVQNNASMVPNDAYAMIDNDVHESDVLSVSYTPRNTVVNNLLNAKCQHIREQVVLVGSGPGSGYLQKTENHQNDKTEHGMEKTVQNQGQSPKMPKSESILKNQQSNRSRN
ncbi:hypothetical protein Tco_0829112 [Tanacetum coccineum]